jgi:hypothetical protein
MHVMDDDAAIKGSMGGRSIHPRPSMHRRASIHLMIIVVLSHVVRDGAQFSSILPPRLGPQGTQGMRARNCNGYLFAESTRLPSINHPS